ncbi:hypothetical protein E4K72_05940 [Oxalobacteraceae bacterium OM1]|nr:hypothetical protein E4K72_05940 [Oxalobacteraceae bacterium OM1]
MFGRAPTNTSTLSKTTCLVAVAGIAAVGLLGCGGTTGSSAPVYKYDAKVQRTSFGVAHVTGNDYASMAYGLGYAFAQDNFCDLAAKITQVNGEYAKHFGADSRVALASSATPNISAVDSDFLHRLQYDKATISATWDKASSATRDMARGYADGVNRYLRETGAGGLPQACRNGSWVREITAADLYLWWTSVATIPGSQSFASMLAGATPPTTTSANASAPARYARMRPQRMLASAAQSLAKIAPSLRDAGSNGWAFGKDATADGRGMLLSNPHWPWTGMNKWHQIHLTVPGKLDAMGVSYPGVPIVLVGFNKSLGWTTTVSTGARTVIRELALGATPTSYVVDGVTKQMTTRDITVDVKGGTPQKRTFYLTEFGPIVNAPSLGLAWTPTRAFAFTDINLANNRVIDHWLALAQSETAVDAAQKMAAILGNPLANLVMADSTGDAVVSDHTVKVNLTDAKIAACALPGVGQALTAQGILTIDGSRSQCNPDQDPSTPQGGILPARSLPYLRRTDYVANANNSYWLFNPSAPLTGLPMVNGAAVAPISLRARMNYTQIEERLAGRDGLPGTKVTPELIQTMLNGSTSKPLIGNRSMAAELLMPAVLELCKTSTAVPMGDGTTQDIGAACTVLSQWDWHYNPESVGVHVFREFFNTASALGNAVWAVPFAPSDPVHTPREPKLGDASVRLKLQQALGAAVRTLGAKGIPLDKPWGELFYTTVNGQNVPMGGGSTNEGLANQMNGGALSASGYNDVSSGSSYVSVMAFGKDGPEVDAVLIPGQSTNPASPYYYDQAKELWAKRKWHRLPFTPAQVAADPKLTQTVLQE